MVARDVPPEVVEGLGASGALGGEQLTAVGDLGATILAQARPAPAVHRCDR